MEGFEKERKLSLLGLQMFECLHIYCRRAAWIRSLQRDIPIGGWYGASATLDWGSYGTSSLVKIRCLQRRSWLLFYAFLLSRALVDWGLYPLLGAVFPGSSGAYPYQGSLLSWNREK